MTATILRWTALFALCMVLQSTIMQSFTILSIRPDLVLVALFFLGIRYGTLPGCVAGFIVGLSQDLYSPSVLGQHALAATVTGFFIGLFNEKIMRTDAVMKIIILLVAFLVHDTIFGIAQVIKLSSPAGPMALSLLTVTIPRGIYSGLVILLYYGWEFYFKPSLRR
jgi:rod shape-determining protein MreD